MGKSSQTLRMLTNEQSLYRGNKQKMGLGYTDPCPLSQAIAYNPKLYDVEVLKESQVKVKEKQFQFNYENIRSLYDTFVPQMELSPEQEYFSDPSTSNVSSKSSSDESNVPNERKLLKLFVNLDNEINKLATFNIDLKMDKHITGLYEDRKGIQQHFSHEVFLISYSLNECSTIIKQEITEEVHEMLNILESMERKVDGTSKKNEILQNKIDQLLEANIANDVRNLVMKSYVEIKNKEEVDKFSKESKMVISFAMMLLKSKKSRQNEWFNLKKILPNLRHKALLLK
ncbi:hypothetical protein Tco_0679185 [Tanacetum coccineum]|uniref:Uncharacterized protein n=1 Tax=Tanacetum coccineum TaxID=301880 RepID=A0ABQ4XIG9_9ASTR